MHPGAVGARGKPGTAPGVYENEPKVSQHQRGEPAGVIGSRRKTVLRMVDIEFIKEDAQPRRSIRKISRTTEWSRQTV